jgi:hypothetical protein
VKVRRPKRSRELRGVEQNIKVSGCQAELNKKDDFFREWRREVKIREDQLLRESEQQRELDGKRGCNLLSVFPAAEKIDEFLGTLPTMVDSVDSGVLLVPVWALRFTHQGINKNLPSPKT